MRSDDGGSVYFVRCEVPRCSKCGQQPERPIKVGYAYNLDRRVNDLQIGSPFDLRLIHSLKSDDAARTERLLHKVHLDSVRIRGEWFREDEVRLLVTGLIEGKILTPDDDEEILRLAESRAGRMRAARAR